MSLVVGSGAVFLVQGIRTFHRQQTIRQLNTYSEILEQSLQAELAAKNWSYIQSRLRKLAIQNEDLLYLIVSDRHHHNQIVAASPALLSGQLVTTLVPLFVTEQADRLTAIAPRTIDTQLLETVYGPEGRVRGIPGDRLLEVAIPIASELEGAPSQGTLRIGFSLNSLHHDVHRSVIQTLAGGSVALAIGLLGAYWLSRRLSRPILQLRASATQIASGDLSHRAELQGVDEVGGLARSFNRMASSLQTSFDQQQKTLDSFARFVPAKFLEAIAPNGIENIVVGQSVRRRMTILFCDIRGYTAMAETMSPTETFEFLNCYLACMGTAIEAEGGFIDKYIGDAIMALFDESHSDGALRAALGMQAALDQFNTDRDRLGLPRIAVGMGIHRGNVILGTIGFVSRIESTVIGDAVNLASRIERFTRQCNCPILLTDAIVAALHCPEDFEIQLVNAAARVRGKAESFGLYQLHSPKTLLFSPQLPGDDVPESLLLEDSGCCPQQPDVPVKSACCGPTSDSADRAADFSPSPQLGQSR
jgi:adenylate cyclase